MADLADIADTAIGRQRFAAAGVAVLVLAAAALSNTERTLFDGAPAPAAFLATPDGGPTAAAVFGPALLRSFAFRRPTAPRAGIGRAQRSPIEPVSAVADDPAPVQVASAAPTNGFAGSPAATGGVSGVGDAPASSIVAPASSPSSAPLSPPPGLTGSSGGGGGSSTGGASSGGTGSSGGASSSGGTTSSGGVSSSGGTTSGGGTTSTGGTTSSGGIGTNPVGAVPEPTTWATMMVGLAAIGGAMRARRTRLRRRPA